MKFSSILKPLMCTAFVLLTAQNGYAQRAGTVDGGGANGLNSKLIESYKVDEQELLLSQTTSTLINFFTKTSYPGLSKYNLMSYANAVNAILLKKNWYLVPTSKGLNNIGFEKHGIPFITDQFAIQTANEVFIDKDIYNSMTGDLFIERDKLILHEVFMGLKVLIKQDGYSQCLFTSNNPKETQSVDYCAEEPKLDAKEFRLSEKDHSDVRYLTDLVIKNRENFNKEDKFQELVLTFVNALYQKEFVSQHLHPYRYGAEDVSVGKLTDLIKSKEILKENFLYCGHGFENSNSESELKKILEKWNNSPKGTVWTFKAKSQVKIVAVQKENKVLIRIVSMGGKILKETEYDRNAILKGYRRNNDYKQSVLSRENNFTELYLKDSLLPKSLGDKAEIITVEINEITGSIRSYKVYDAVTYRKDNMGTASKWLNKLSCSDSETIVYKK